MAVDLAHAHVAGGHDELGHQLVAEAPALHVVADDDGELARLRIGGLDGQPGDAEHAGRLFALPWVQGSQGDLAVVVDVAVAHQHGLGDLLDRPEEAELHACRTQRADHLGPERLVFRLDRPDVDLLAVDGVLPLVLAGVHADHQMRPRQGNFAHVLGFDHDARIQRAEAVRAHLQRVGVHLGDLREVDQQVAELHQRLLQGDHVYCRTTAEAGEQPADLGALDHRLGERLVEWREVDGYVAIELHTGAAHAEHDRRPESAVALGADDDFVAAARHGLHGDADDLRLRLRLLDPLGDLRELVRRLWGGAHVEGDAADVALVGDVVAEDLDGHREADLLGDPGALLRGGGHLGGHYRDVVGRQHLLGLDFAEDLAARTGHFQKDLLYRVTVGVEVRQDVGRCLVQVRQAAGVLVQVHEGAHRVFRRVEVRHVSGPQRAHTVGHFDLAHERRQHGLGGVVGRHSDERLGRLRRIAHRLRCEDGDDAVDVGILHENLGGVAVAHVVGISADVHRVAAGGEARQDALEPFVGLWTQLGQFAAQVQQAVGGHDAGPAGVSQDSQPGAARADLAAERLRAGEQVLDLVHPHNAGAAEGGAVKRVVAGYGPSVAGGGYGRACCAAALDHDDRLGLGEMAGGAHELARVGNGLHVQDDGAGVRVGAEVVDEIAEVDVAHGADGHEG